MIEVPSIYKRLLFPSGTHPSQIRRDGPHRNINCFPYHLLYTHKLHFFEFTVVFSSGISYLPHLPELFKAHAISQNIRDGAITLQSLDRRLRLLLAGSVGLRPRKSRKEGQEPEKCASHGAIIARIPGRKATKSPTHCNPGTPDRLASEAPALQ